MVFSLTANPLDDIVVKWELRIDIFTPAYPQGNGQAEAINKVIINGIKKRLDDAKGKWVEELPHVLWTYRTMPRRSTRETPFFNDLWSRGRHPPGDRFSNTKDQLVQSK